MRATWTIARRELRSMFDHPTGYILLIVFLAISEFLFFRQAYILQSASLRPMMDMLPWVFLFFVPAVTMRALAEDARTGTIEIVLAQPITEAQLLIGKFLGQVIFIWIALLCTVPVAIGLSFGADLHAGIIVAQYVGAGFLALGMAGVGVWSSSISRNQITAFIVASAVLFLLILLGLDPLLVGLPPALGGYAASLSILSHFGNIARGVIDLRDVVYFLTLAAVFLFFAYHSLMSRKLAPRGQTIRRLRLGVGLLTAAAIVVNLFGRHIGGRLDLTPGRTYTLSAATENILESLPDIVTIKFYASQEVPAEFSLMKRDVEDLLRDYRAAGDGKVRVVMEDPGADSTAKADASQLGIPAVQFNVMGRSELQVKEGYMGLAVSYANSNEIIPTVQRTDDLEYRLSTFIRQLTRPTKPSITLVQSTRDAQNGRTYDRLLQEIRTQGYEVRTLGLAEDTALTPDTKVLVLAGTPDSFPEALQQKVNGYLAGGGSALVFSAGMSLSGQQQFAQPLPITWNPALQPYGLEIEANMVFDRASNRPVPMPSQFGQMLVPYPFFVLAPSTKASVVNQGLEGAFLPWSSTVDTSAARPGTVTPLFITSRAAGIEGLRVPIHPMRDWPQDSLRTRLLAVQVNPLADSAVADSGAPRGRLIVVGNTDFATDRFMLPENTDFLLNAIDWLGQETDLIAIRSKDRTPPKLVFESAAAQDAVKYANLIGVPVLLVALASVRLLRRRRKQKEPYRKLVTEPVEVRAV